MLGRAKRDREFCEFVQARRSRLMGAAYLLCGNRHDAEEAYVRRILANAATDPAMTLKK